MAAMDEEPLYREEEAEAEDSDPAFTDAVMAAFPGEEWDDERLAGLKEAIRLCVEKDRAGGYGKPKKGGGMDLVLAFGGGGGKGKK